LLIIDFAPLLFSDITRAAAALMPLFRFHCFATYAIDAYADAAY